MALEQRLLLKQVQKLIMTPALQQAIRLLPLTRLELADIIREELTENPVLEEITTLQDEVNSLAGEDTSSEKKEASDVDYDTYIQSSFYESSKGGGGSFNKRDSSIEDLIRQPLSLASHLEWQLDVSAYSDLDKKIGMLLIGNINNDGYLTIDAEEIAGTNKYDIADVKRVLRLIQSFDPLGVGAKDLRECLMLQMQQMGGKNPVAEDIVRDHLKELEGQHYDMLAKQLSLPVEKIIEAVKFIKKLVPNPGSRFTSDDTHYIVPDVFVLKGKEDYHIILNEEGMPKLSISPFYRNFLGTKTDKDETKDYVEDKFKSALWLIKSIEHRRNTIIKVAESIVKKQKEFLDNGVNYLKPLILKDVAKDIEMHESTISRVTTNKYMHTPQGLFEFRYFFSSGIGDLTRGEAMSSVTIKDMIKNIISNESHDSPFNDIALTDILQARNIPISRRTVTKYRKELKIKTAGSRKRGNLLD